MIGVTYRGTAYFLSATAFDYFVLGFPALMM